MTTSTGVSPDPPDEGLAARMARVAGAAMFVRAVDDPATADLTDDQRSLAAFRAHSGLQEALTALGELLPVLMLRAEAGESVEQMLVEVDAAPPPDEVDPVAAMEIASTRPLVPVSIIAISIAAEPQPPEDAEYLWRRLDERLWDLEAANPQLHAALSRRVAAALEAVRSELPPDVLG